MNFAGKQTESLGGINRLLIYCFSSRSCWICILERVREFRVQSHFGEYICYGIYETSYTKPVYFMNLLDGGECAQ